MDIQFTEAWYSPKSKYRAANNFPDGCGQIVQSNLFLLGHLPFLARQTLIIIILNLEYLKLETQFFPYQRKRPDKTYFLPAIVRRPAVICSPGITCIFIKNPPEMYCIMGSWNQSILKQGITVNSGRNLLCNRSWKN